MAIIVEHQTTGIQYLLVGTGYSHYKEGTDQMVAVCDAKGKLYWLSSDEVCVLSIQGVPVSDLLPDHQENTMALEKCPACGYPVSATTRVCPSCELTLIYEEEDHVL